MYFINYRIISGKKMLLLEGYISNFTRARYYFLCVEFSDFYVNQSLVGQTITTYMPFTIILNTQEATIFFC
jgi:hypothetical protein